MKLNKKIIGIGLVAVAALGLAACARGGRGGSAADSKVKAAIVTDTGGVDVFKLGVKLTNLKKIQVSLISNQTQNLILQQTCHQL